MGKTRKDGKPRGKMSSYAWFVKVCREEHHKKHPGEQVVFAEFSKKCSEKWKQMGPKEKKRFEEMAERDKVRFDREMVNYVPAKGEKGSRKKKKDPNAPKRPLSAFFFFCNDERAKVRAQFPGYGVGDVAKELGKRWEVCPNKPKYEAMAAKDKQRFERENTAYKKGGFKKAAPPVEDDDDDDEEDESDEE